MARSPSADGKQGSGSGPVVLLIIGSVLLVLSPFLPLVLALAEQGLFGTQHVEEFCKMIGIHGALTMLYRPIIEFFL